MMAPSDVNVTTKIDLSCKYGAALPVFTGLRYDLASVSQNPLRAYPSPMALYGMELDGTLSQHTAFSTNFAMGKDQIKGVFTRGQGGPATLALAAIGAERVPAESAETRTWDSVK